MKEQAELSKKEQEQDKKDEEAAELPRSTSTQKRFVVFKLFPFLPEFPRTLSNFF